MVELDSCWTTRTKIINPSLFILTILLTIVILVQKSIEGFFIFLLCLFIIIPFQWIVCCNCKYYGLICPSFGFSLVARLFPPKEPEDRVFQLIAVVIDVLLIMFCFLIPVIIWIASILLNNSVQYSQLDHFVMTGYIILALVMTIVYNRTACSKCDITACWLCGDRSENRYEVNNRR